MDKQEMQQLLHRARKTENRLKVKMRRAVWDSEAWMALAELHAEMVAEIQKLEEAVCQS